MSKQTKVLVSCVQEQWERTWAMWEGMIHNIPDEEWIKGDIDYLIPARHLIHVTVGDEVFMSDMPFEQYDYGQWFEVEAWETPAAELPSKKVALEKLADYRDVVAARLAQLDDAALLEPEKAHPWTGQIRLSKLIFNQRHIQHHLGEMNAELSRRGIEGVAW